MVLAAGYLGFGALANGSAFPLWAALLSTLTIFALPGQLAMLEMSIAGAAPLIVVITVSLTAARFLDDGGAASHVAFGGQAAMADLCGGSPARDDGLGRQHAALPRLAAGRAPAVVRRLRIHQLGVLSRRHRGGIQLAHSMPPLVRQGLVLSARFISS